MSEQPTLLPPDYRPSERVGSLFTSQDQPDDDGKDDCIDKDIDHISPLPLDPRTPSARASVVMVARAMTNGTMGNPGRSAILM